MAANLEKKSNKSRSTTVTAPAKTVDKAVCDAKKKEDAANAQKAATAMTKLGQEYNIKPGERIYDIKNIK